jgi:predicted nucleic acid-binding protein
MNPALLVIDASVVIKWVLPEPGRLEALELLDAYEAGTVDLIAPRLLMEEVASALSKRCRSKELTAAQAQQAFRLVAFRQPAIPGETDLHAALSLSLAHQLSLWDSVYLALAIDQRCDLVTADRRLSRAVTRHYPFVRLLT